MYLVCASVVAAVVNIIVKISGVEYFYLGSRIGMSEYMNGIWYVSLLTVGVAYIAGKGGVAFIIGGFLCYWVLAPFLDLSGLMPVDPETASSMTDPDRLQQFLYRSGGIGMLVGGAVAGVLMALPLIVTAKIGRASCRVGG